MLLKEYKNLFFKLYTVLFCLFFFSPSSASAMQAGHRSVSLHEKIEKGLRLFKSANYQEAESYFREALKGYPDNPQVQNNLAVVIFKQGHITEAEKCLKKAISLEPWYLEPYFNLAHLYLFLSHGDRALKVFNNSLLWGASRLDWGFFFYDTQNLLYAKKAFYDQTQFNPKDHWAYYGLGITLFCLELPRAALGELLSAYEISPDIPEVLNALGVVEGSIGNVKKAESYFVKSVEKHPSFLPSYVSLARLYLKEGMFDEYSAIVNLLNTENNTPFDLRHSAEFSNLYGEKLYLEGKKTAFKFFKKARRIDPNLRYFTLFNAGRKLENMGEFKRAIKLYKDALIVSCTSYQAWFRLGLCHFYIDQFDKAIKAYKKAGEYGNNFVLDYFIGICYKDMSAWDESVFYLQRSIKKKNNPKAQLALALIYKKRNKQKQAATHFANLLYLEPKNNYAKKQLAFLGVSGKKLINAVKKASLADSKILYPKAVMTRNILPIRKRNAVLPKEAEKYVITGVLQPENIAQQKNHKGAKSHYYALQVFSSRKYEIAENFLKKLEKKGYQGSVVAREVEGKDTWYRVRIGHFGTAKEAEEFGHKVKKREKLSFWVSKVDIVSHEK